MEIVIFTHPAFTKSNSMPKYAEMLERGLKQRGHTVEVWTPKAYFNKFPFKAAKKWLGYIDQFIIFPLRVKVLMTKKSKNTLYVLADQSLGPWMYLIFKKPHVIHCHDFLAQRSERKELSENKLNISGKIYQRWIRSGYKKGENFISISQKTNEDLHRFLGSPPEISEVIYNGLNQDFKPEDQIKTRERLKKEWDINLKTGFILHVGGNQFYKNRVGVIKIYDAWRKISAVSLPLLMIGPPPNKDLIVTRAASKFHGNIHFLSNIPDKLLKSTYSAATVLLFPSLEEGFGWPIAEAMASGCPVITTNKAPMTEVGKESCFYIPRRPENMQLQENWANKCAIVLDEVVNLSESERKNIVASGIENAKRFNTGNSIESIESVYKKILKISVNESIAGNSVYGSC